MQAGEKRTLKFRTVFEEKGFPNSAPLTRIVGNGSFLNNYEVAPMLGMDDNLLLTDRAKRRKHGLPPERRPAIHISATMEDWVLGYKSQLAFFERMKKEVPDYPIRFVLFDDGSHGLPIRMTDWRLILNWMLEAEGR